MEAGNLMPASRDATNYKKKVSWKFQKNPAMEEEEEEGEKT